MSIEDLAPAPAETQDFSPESVTDQITAELAQEMTEETPQEATETPADGETAQEATTDTEEQSEASPDAEDAPAPEEDTASEMQESEDADSPSLDAPARWDAQGQGLWATMTPEQQAFISERERVLQAYSTQQNQQLSEFRKASLAANETDAALTQTLTTLRTRVDAFAEYSTDDLRQAYNNVDDAGKQQISEALAIRSQVEQLEKVEADREQKRHAAFRREENAKLVELVPEFGDPQTGTAKIQELVGYLSQSGYDNEQLRYAAASDLSLAHKAMKYDALMAAKNKATPAPVKTGKATRSKPAQTAQTQSKRRSKAFSKIGSTDALADVIAMDLADEMANF